MQDASAPAGELTDERQRDHALTGTWPAGDDDHLFGVGSQTLVESSHHQVVGDLLLVEKDELLALLHLLGGQ